MMHLKYTSFYTSTNFFSGDLFIRLFWRGKRKHRNEDEPERKNG